MWLDVMGSYHYVLNTLKKSLNAFLVTKVKNNFFHPHILCWPFPSKSGSLNGLYLFIQAVWYCERWTEGFENV
jgi:hypothetical protein